MEEQPFGHTADDYVRHARLFVSCAAADEAISRTFVSELENEGYRVASLWSFTAGLPWRQSIETAISSAHAVVVLWTSAAAQSEWVQSEIGFALGRCIPLFLVRAGGRPPKGMANEIQHIDRDAVLRTLSGDLPKVLEGETDMTVPMQIARYPDERSGWLGQRSQEVAEPSMIRQAALFSTFAIPRDDPVHKPKRWESRDGGSRPQGRRVKQYDERCAIQRHTEGAGAKLIISPRRLRRGAKASCARLAVLRSFLDSADAGRVAVAWADKDSSGNLTIVGDQFMCESRSPGLDGFSYTTFTTHGPTVLHAIQRFDESFANIDPDAERDLAGSRRRAVARIREIEKELCKE